MQCATLLKYGTPEQRFWTKVDKRGPDECWPWRAGRDQDGYGMFTINHRGVRAHRFAFELAYGSIDPELLVLHACDQPPCCNPAHLSQGTNEDNLRQMSERGRAPTGDMHYSHTSPDLVPRGERNGNSKLTADKVIQIRAKYAGGQTDWQTLAAAFGVTAVCIRNVVRRKTWKHVP